MFGNSDDHNGQDESWSRRRMIGTLTAASIGIPLSTATSAVAKGSFPEPYEDNKLDGITFTHLTEFESVKRTLKRYSSTEDPTHLYHHTLVEKLQEDTGRSEFDLVVSTMGKRTSMTRNDRRGETLYGFRPTDREVDALSRFGDVTYVGDLVSTKVCVRNVTQSDIARIASLPMVVQVSHQPGSVNLFDTYSPDNPIDVSDIAGSSWDQFTSAHGNYTAYYVNIGLVDTGYDYQSYGKYASNYAKDIGLDTSLSKDFTSESDPFNDTDFNGHGTNVGDTAAYMLKDGDTHSDLFVSLKIFADGTDSSAFDENVRQSLEYATKNGIDVLSMPIDTTDGPFTKCPSTYCSELDSYTEGGGVPVVSVDNADNTSKVEHPACSWLSVGVGGVKKKQNDGDVVEHPTDSEYGDILFYDPFSDTTYCPWCYNASGVSSSFSPESYGVWGIKTDASKELGGTSFATPQVAAAAWIDFADGGINSYSSAMDKFTQMGEYKVVNNDGNSDPAQEGDLVEADYYF